MVVAASGQRSRRGASGQHDLTRALECFWHPVCPVEELATVGDRPTPVRLLGRDLVVCRFADGDVVALEDRCAHRSTRLSIGTVEPGAVRCAHHGWRWGSDGACVAIPSMPDGPIPARARIGHHETTERAGLVWVRLDGDSSIHPPPVPTWEQEGLRVASGEPYTWPVAAARRVESFVDTTLGAWLCEVPAADDDGVRDPAPADVERRDGTMRYVHVHRAGTDPVTVTVRITMPGTVTIDVRGPGPRRRGIWMTASPLDDDRCRCFWSVAHDTDDDDEVLTPHRRWLEATGAIVSNQSPGWFPLDAGDEISIRTDLVSNVYRRWLRELVAETKRGGAPAAARSLGRPVAHARGAAG